MKLDFTEIHGKQVYISDLEYLYTYTNDNGDQIVVYEYEGEKIEKKVIKNEPH